MRELPTRFLKPFEIQKERDEFIEALRNVLEEEGRVISDGLESQTTEEDVLRTPIVSVKELLDEREKWTSAIQTEMRPEQETRSDETIQCGGLWDFCGEDRGGRLYSWRRCGIHEICSEEERGEAIYGLRQSPKRWGDHRDRKLREMVRKSGYFFRQSIAEPVEDLAYQDGRPGYRRAGVRASWLHPSLCRWQMKVIEETLEAIQKEWQTSGKVKYLGMELYETEDSFFFFACQEDYAMDHLNAMPDQPKSFRRSRRDMYPEAEEKDPQSVKRAQQIAQHPNST